MEYPKIQWHPVAFQSMSIKNLHPDGTFCTFGLLLGIPHFETNPYVETFHCNILPHCQRGRPETDGVLEPVELGGLDRATAKGDLKDLWVWRVGV